MKQIGKIADLTVYRSNQLAQATVAGKQAYSILFGHKFAIAFAAQITKVEGPVRGTRDFSDHYRGLSVYGYKVIQPEALGVVIGVV